MILSHILHLNLIVINDEIFFFIIKTIGLSCIF